MGTELLERTGLLCYLQASEQGRCLYQHHGFEEIDTVDFNLSDYGLDGTPDMTEMTRGVSPKLLLSTEVGSYLGSAQARSI